MKFRDVVQVDVQEPSKPGTVVVGKEAEFDEAKVGGVTGLKAQGKVDLPKVDNVEVLPGAKIKKSEMGDIAGMILTGEGSQSPSGKSGKPIVEANSVQPKRAKPNSEEERDSDADRT
jgi:hypothetical protein